MAVKPPLELVISVSGGLDLDVYGIERDTADLRASFTMLGLGVAEVRESEAPQGSRGDALATIGMLVVQLLPPVLELIPAVLDVVRDWSRTPRTDLTLRLEHRRPDGTYSKVDICGGSEALATEALTIYRRALEHDLGAGDGV